MGKEKNTKMVILSKYQIIRNAYVDLIGLLKEIMSFLDDNKYDWVEQGVGEKPTDMGSELKAEFMALREVTDYIKFNFFITVFVRDIKKVKLDTGEDAYWARLMVTISSDADKNWNETFPKGHWGELKRQLYERYVIPEKLVEYKGKLYNESMLLIDRIKTHFK